MKKIILFIIMLCFSTKVYALDNNITEVNQPINVYQLTDRIDDEEINEDENKGNIFQYFILIAVFIGVSALFLFLKDESDE